MEFSPELLWAAECKVEGKTVDVVRLDRGRIGDDVVDVSIDILDVTRDGIGSAAGAAGGGSSRGFDGSLGMDFLRQGVGSSAAAGTGTGAATEEVRPLECSWNVEVERTEWPVLSPDRTNPLLEDEVVLTPDAGIVGRVTLDVCIIGDGSTSIDNLRGIDPRRSPDEADPVIILTSCTLLYWIVTPLEAPLLRRSAGISVTTIDEL